MGKDPLIAANTVPATAVVDNATPTTLRLIGFMRIYSVFSFVQDSTTAFSARSFRETSFLCVSFEISCTDATVV